MTAGVLGDGSTINHLEEHGRTVQMWENVLHYGADPTGSTVCTTAIQAAIDAVTKPANTATFGHALFFPYGTYKFGALDWNDSFRTVANDIWVKVIVAGTLRPQVTMTLYAHRLSFEGWGGGRNQNFSSGSFASIDGQDVASGPALRVTFGANGSTSFEMKNIAVINVVGTGVAVDQGFCLIKMDGVNIQLQSASTGSCMTFGGGFGYHFTHCQFNAGSGGSAGPAVSFVNTDGTDPCRIMSFKHCFFNYRGVNWSTGVNGAGAATSFLFDQILYENMKEAFLTIDTTHNFATGWSLRNVEIADYLISPAPLVKNTGTQTKGMTIENCTNYTACIQAGSTTINGLRVFEGNGTSPTLGATTGYSYFGKNGEVSVAGQFSFPPTTLTSTSGSINAALGTNVFILSPGSHWDLSQIDNTVAGQIITLIFTNGNTKLYHGAAIKLNGAADFSGTADDTITLVSDGSTLYEIARSVNA